MPHMNRIRVNNVKYNFGTQQYDDFVLRFHGKNTIYDLANGGGKSVLMLLLMQNLIPNCTLDEKQPIEKLFRTSGGSTTIHSLVEWNLDECDIKEGYRFMLTGFCARKARESAKEEENASDTAAIDYFNYCIFYRTYNSNDIVNLPLVQNGERITYQGLRDYLKQLEHTALDLKVYVFDRKGEYQQFISHYGLYESSWEIIRGINKTEGHVRTYFETNYKTTRKVVEDLLIEEIIETSFRDKTQKEDMNESMAKTLLDMKDKLMELSQKRSTMERFARQKEELNGLLLRIRPLQEMYEKKDNLSKELLRALALLEKEVKEGEEKLASYSRKVEEKKQECMDKNRVIACLNVQQEQEALALQKEQVQTAYENCLRQKEIWQKKKKSCEERECVNDYLEYAQLKAKREEQRAVMDKVKEGFGADTGRLYEYAACKKKKMKDRLDDVKARVETFDKEEQKVRAAYENALTKKHTVECEQAVLHATVSELEGFVKEREADLAEKRQEAGILLLEDLPEELHRIEQQKKQWQEEQDVLSRQEEEYHKKSLNLTLRRREYELLQKEEESRKENQKQTLSMLQQGMSQIDVLLAVYELEKENDYEKNLDKLKRKIEQKLTNAYQVLITMKSELESSKKALDNCEKGWILTDETKLHEMVHYLTQQYHCEVCLVQEYLLTKPHNVQQEILKHWSYAPYGLVILKKGTLTVESLQQDTTLQDSMASLCVPVFLPDMLMKGEYHEKGLFFLHGNMSCSYEPDKRKQEQTVLAEQVNSQERQLAMQEKNISDIRRELLEVQKQESLLQVVLMQNTKEPAQNLNFADLTQNLEDYAKKLADIQEEEKGLSKQQEETNRKKQEVTKKLAQSQIQIQQLRAMLSDYQTYQDSLLKLKETKQKGKKKEQENNVLEQEISFEKQKLEEVAEKKQGLLEQIEQAQTTWKTLYEAYDNDGPAADLEITEEQLDREFASMKEIAEKGVISLKDKQELYDTLTRNMEKLKDRIAEKGGQFEELSARYEKQELYETSKEDKKRLLEEVKQEQNRYEQAEAAYREIQTTCSKLEGRVEHGMKQLEEQGIYYTPLPIAKEEVSHALKEQKAVFAALMKQREELLKQKETIQKEHAGQVDFYKDVKRCVEIYKLTLPEEEWEQLKEENGDFVEYSFEQLKNCRRAFERVIDEEKKAQRQFEEYKQATTEHLQKLQAYELAEVIYKDVKMPENLVQLQELSDSLKDMTGYLQLEEQRVEQGIADMQLIKSNFESQCIRRCEDVKTELERLPKLSGITLDSETIQVISLSVPYVPQEQLESRMSEYIDQIVKGVDQYETVAERMQYIRRKLALKRLFSVAVTDMNAIRLYLYKRERIREQSRYLRYEEAVGSTGQSQGIYIQFLIAIINYIANLHSVNTSNDELGKVIFLDNPFGAAKDVYIWEPIFEMLKTNNVQLIVPARGATPAITSRFDVNYVLGQKMVGNRQQTVVVDYRSQVENAEIEYKKLEYSQNSFEFI